MTNIHPNRAAITVTATTTASTSGSPMPPCKPRVIKLSWSPMSRNSTDSSRNVITSQKASIWRREGAERITPERRPV
jgi:hypothetical protein